MGDANKRGFRAKPAPAPSYPRLLDVDANTLRTWGLIAVGGLALGGGGCKPNAAVAGAMPAATGIDGGTAHKAATKAQEKPAEPVALPPPGAPPPARVEPEPKPQPKQQPSTTKPQAATPKEKTKPDLKMGKMRPPRLEPND